MRANYMIFVILIVVAAWSSTLAAKPEEKSIAVQQEHSDRVDLFDFLKYKQLFKKTYASIIEEAVRAKYFMSRALRAFASALSFKFRHESYYLSVNHLSDQSPAELELMENHLLEDFTPNRGDRNHRVFVRRKPTVDDIEMLSDSRDDVEDLPQFVADFSHENLNKTLHNLLKAHRGEPGYGELELAFEGGANLQPVDVATGSGVLPPRELPLSRLINTGEDVALPPEAQAKVVGYVPSNNPFYERVELPTRGLTDEQKPVEWHLIDKPDGTNPIEQLGRFLGVVGNNFLRTLNPEFRQKQDKQREEARMKQLSPVQEKDEVYVDLRQTNCMFLPRDQGHCGSCYAFTAITVMEFLRCRETGQLVAMSEQYLIDCGSKFVNHMSGCKGGRPTGVAVFVRNFGLHLRNQYPYRERNEQCPYEERTNPKHTGYLRPVDFSSSAFVDMGSWREALKHGPLMVAIATGPAFKEFGGGVYSGKKCPRKATHAVLVVGHGRADNREYWLLRNSHGTGWGEQGYMRLDKDSDCIHPKMGYAFGVPDPKLFRRVHFSENKLHKAEGLLAKLPKAEQEST